MDTLTLDPQEAVFVQQGILDDMGGAKGDLTFTLKLRPQLSEVVKSDFVSIAEETLMLATSLIPLDKLRPAFRHFRSIQRLRASGQTDAAFRRSLLLQKTLAEIAVA